MAKRDVDLDKLAEALDYSIGEFKSISKILITVDKIEVTRAEYNGQSPRRFVTEKIPTQKLADGFRNQHIDVETVSPI